MGYRSGVGLQVRLLRSSLNVQADTLVAMFGALMSERLGRRVLWLTSACGCLFAYTFIIVCSARFDITGNAAAGRATIAFIYIVCRSLANFKARAQLTSISLSSTGSTPLALPPSETVCTLSRFYLSAYERKVSPLRASLRSLRRSSTSSSTRGRWRSCESSPCEDHTSETVTDSR